MGPAQWGLGSTRERIRQWNHTSYVHISRLVCGLFYIDYGFLFSICFYWRKRSCTMYNVARCGCMSGDERQCGLPHPLIPILYRHVAVTCAILRTYLDILCRCVISMQSRSRSASVSMSRQDCGGSHRDAFVTLVGSVRSRYVTRRTVTNMYKGSRATNSFAGIVEGSR